MQIMTALPQFPHHPVFIIKKTNGNKCWGDAMEGSLHALLVQRGESPGNILKHLETRPSTIWIYHSGFAQRIPHHTPEILSHPGSLHDSKETGPAQMSINWRMDNENMAHVQNGISFSCKAKGNYRIYRQRDGNGNYGSGWADPGQGERLFMLFLFCFFF